MILSNDSIFERKSIPIIDPDFEPGGDNLCRQRRASLPVAEKFFVVGGNHLFFLMREKTGGHLLWCPPEY